MLALILLLVLVVPLFIIYILGIRSNSWSAFQTILFLMGLFFVIFVVFYGFQFIFWSLFGKLCAIDGGSPCSAPILRSLGGSSIFFLVSALFFFVGRKRK